MKSPLRWKILLFTALPIVGLALAALFVVNRDVSQRVHENIEQDLVRAAEVFEDILAQRSEQLAVASGVLVADPRFFSVLTLPGSRTDAAYRNTVAGVARDFNAITRADLFDVLDARGGLVASEGRDKGVGLERAPLVAAALAGQTAGGILAAGGAHYQVTVAPVRVGGRLVGVLLLGSRIGQSLAERLKHLTRCEVHFVSAGAVSGSTLTEAGEQAAVREVVGGTRAGAPVPGTSLPGDDDLVRTHTPSGMYLTLVRRIPGSHPEDRQHYALLRPLGAETAFLRRMQTGLLEIGILAALVAFLAAFLISERITTPVERLVRAAEEIERGNYDFPLDVKSDDEIGYLAKRFEDMRQHERAYVTSLREVARLKSDFISVASHELRTPISVISGYHELLAHSHLGPLTKQQEMALEAIRKGVETLSRIADDATRIAQLEGERLVLSLAEHDVAEILKEAMRQALDQASGRRLRTTLEVDRGMPSLRVDGARLGEAIANLVRNAVRFTPDDGRIEVRSEWEGGWLTVQVRDTGVGIVPEARERIFEQGYVVRNSLHHHSSQSLEFNSSGLGLGLPIARGIVEAHGGTITVESEPGSGSAFTIRVPAEPADPMARAA